MGIAFFFVIFGVFPNKMFKTVGRSSMTTNKHFRCQKQWRRFLTYWSLLCKRFIFTTCRFADVKVMKTWCIFLIKHIMSTVFGLCLLNFAICFLQFVTFKPSYLHDSSWIYRSLFYFYIFLKKKCMLNTWHFVQHRVCGGGLLKKQRLVCASRNRKLKYSISLQGVE